MRHGSRYARPRMRLASSSLRNMRFAGSQVSLRFNCAQIQAACEATCVCAGDLGIGAWRRARPDALDEFADVLGGRVVTRALLLRDERLQIVGDLDAAAVADLHPAFRAFEAVAARPQPAPTVIPQDRVARHWRTGNGSYIARSGRRRGRWRLRECTRPAACAPCRRPTAPSRPCATPIRAERRGNPRTRRGRGPGKRSSTDARGTGRATCPNRSRAGRVRRFGRPPAVPARIDRAEADRRVGVDCL